MTWYGLPAPLADADGNLAAPPGAFLDVASSAMQVVYQIVHRVAPSHSPVLLLGESGVGKKTIAQAIHHLSPRASGPLLKVHCGRLSERMLERDLLGYVQGAFAGAAHDRSGRLEAACGGTIVLDEIDRLPLGLQLQLLRVLEEQAFERVGDATAIAVDTRVIATSLRDLTTQVIEQRFREDLYWRLNVVPIYVPPLRDRVADIPGLVSHFLELCAQTNHRPSLHVLPETIDAMRGYHWPGNVRELQTCVERAVVLADGDRFGLDLLPASVRSGGKGELSTASVRGVDLETLVQEVVEQGVRAAESEQLEVHSYVVNRVEKELIAQVLANCNHVQTKAAAKLGINRNTLYKKIKDYRLEPAEPSEAEK